MTPRRKFVAGVAAGIVAGGSAGALAAAPVQPGDSGPGQVGPGVAAPAAPPNMAPAVLLRLEADYLSADERAEARVFHGVWRDGDLSDVALRARAALIAGAIGDPSLDDPAAPAEDRAEALLLRGEPGAAMALLSGRDSWRSARLRAEALESLGRFDEVAGAAAGGPAGEPATAADAVEAVLAGQAAIRSSAPGAAGVDFRGLMQRLGRARDDLDRLYWPAMAAEAALLSEKDNPAQARDAVMAALSMCPSSAAAWSVTGRMAAASFQFELAASVAARLDRSARSVSGAGAVSAEAAIITARARLRQLDGEGAAAALAPVRSLWPGHREALALDAAAAALRFDSARRDELVAEFEALSPGSPGALLEVGRALAEARQYADAARALGDAAGLQPGLAEPWIELGLVEMQAGRDGRALDALRRAAELDPFNIRAANSLKLLGDLAAFESIRTDHFEIRYRPGPDAVLAREMAPVLERIHARVTGAGPGGIGHAPPAPTRVELMPDHAAFAVRIAGMPRIHTMAASTGPVIAMEAPREGPGHLVGAYDWPRVVQHEYTHTVTLSLTGNRIPHWFTEAAAVHLEDAPRDEARAELLAAVLAEGRLFDLSEINLRFVRPLAPSDRAQAYAQGHWMYEFIVTRWGDRAPVDLMRRFAAGEKEDAAFPSVLGLEVDAFMRDFRAWARERVAEWGLAPAPGTPTLAQLRLRDASNADPAPVQRALARWAESLAWAAAGAGAGGQPWRPALRDVEDADLDRWLAEWPDHPELLSLAVERTLDAAEGELDESVTPLLERFAAARPVASAPRKQLAAIYLRSADEAGRARAVPHLEWLDAREQNARAYAVELARRYAAAGDWDRASAKAERAVMLSPYDPENREFAATVALRRKDYDTAERHIRALGELEPDREIHKKRLEALQKQRSGM